MGLNMRTLTFVLNMSLLLGTPVLAQSLGGKGCGGDAAGAAARQNNDGKTEEQRMKEANRFAEINFEVIAQLIVEVAGPEWRAGREPRNKIAYVSRAGQDMNRDGTVFSWESNGANKVTPVYSHAGILVYDSRTRKFLFKHLLNICEGPTSSVFRESPLVFMAPTALRYDLRVTIPSPDMQRKLSFALHENNLRVWAGALHHKFYNGISNPYALAEAQESNGQKKPQYQNSNQYVLTVFDHARLGFSELGLISSNWKAAAETQIFQPLYVRFGLQNSFGAAAKMSDNFRIDDHPRLQPWRAFVSADTVHRYIKATDPESREFEVCPTKNGQRVCGRPAAHWLSD